MFQCILLIFALREIGEAGIPGCLRGVVFVHHNTILPVRAESVLQRLSWSDRPIERDEFENQQLWLANSLGRGNPLSRTIHWLRTISYAPLSSWDKLGIAKF